MQLPGPRQMLLRGALLLTLLLLWLVLDGVGLDVASWLRTVGLVAVWVAGGLALFWLIREVLPTLRRRRRS